MTSHRPTAAAPSRIALKATGLTMRFGEFLAVNDVDLSVREGSIHALIGPNGAGKTTVFNLLTKFLQPTAGSIHYQGRDITRSSAVDIARMGVVRSFQISSVMPRLSVLDNVRVALQRPKRLATQFWRSDRALAVLDPRARELLAAVGLASHLHVPAGSLAYGRKRALELATTLALDPELLLLDEPMAGLAPEDIPVFAQLIRDAARQRTVLMVEHNLSVVADLCDRITVLQRGEVLAEGNYAEVSANVDVRRAYIGEDEDDD